MHELRIARPIVESALQALSEQKVSKVESVKIALGVLSGVEEDHLRAHITELTGGTPLEGARLEFTKLLPGQTLPSGEKAIGNEVFLLSLTVVTESSD